MPRENEGWLTSLRRPKLRGLAAAKIRPDLSRPVAAAGAYQTRLDIRQANIVRPAIGTECNVVPATAVDQHAAQAHLAHLTKGSLHWRPSSCIGVWRVALDR